MDHEEPLQTECSVSGLLSVVLHVSRIIGMAPLKFDKLNNGWRIRVSRIYSLIGQTMVIVFTIFSILGLIEDLKTSVNSEFKTNTKALATTKVFMMSAGANVGAYIGVNRMRYVVNSLSHLKQINKELNGYYQTSSPNDKKMWSMLTVIVSLVFVSSFIIHGSFVYFMIIVKDYISRFNIFYELLTIEIELLVVQFSLISMCLVPTLEQLNGCLNSLYKTINKSEIDTFLFKSSGPERLMIKNNLTSHKSANKIIQVNPKMVGKNIDAKSSAPIRRLAFNYSSLCDIIRQLDHSHGCMLVILPLILMLQLIVTPYNVLCGWLYATHTNYISSIIMFVGCLSIVLNFGMLLLVVEPCHRTYEQMERAKELVHQMTLGTSPDDHSVISDLNLFYQQVMLNQVTYSPMKLFTLNRTLIITIISSITTYLVIIIQM